MEMEQLAIITLPLYLLSSFNLKSRILEFSLIIIPIYISILNPKTIIFQYLILFGFNVFIRKSKAQITFINKKVGKAKASEEHYNKHEEGMPLNNVMAKEYNIISDINEEGMPLHNGIAKEYNTKSDINEEGKPLHNVIAKEYNTMSDITVAERNKIALNVVRFIIITSTTICILLCDFNFWVKRLGKSDYYDSGLMDLGIGFFVINGGLFSSKSKRSKNGFLFLLGLIRLAVIYICKLDVNPAEYGFHLNFYFILFLINILFKLVDSKFNFHVGIILLAAHEILVSCDCIKLYLFSDCRSTLFSMNKEGLACVVPLFGLYLVSNKIGSMLLTDSISASKLYTDCLYVFLNCHYTQSSRRLCNLRYTVGILFMTVHCLYFSLKANIKNSKLVDFSSKNMMKIFLYSNILVLISKFGPELLSLNFFGGNIYMMGYLIIVFLCLPTIV